MEEKKGGRAPLLFPVPNSTPTLHHPSILFVTEHTCLWPRASERASERGAVIPHPQSEVIQVAIVKSGVVVVVVGSRYNAGKRYFTWHETLLLGREVSREPRGVPCEGVAVPFIVIGGISPFLEGDLTTFKGNILAPIPAKDNLFRGPTIQTPLLHSLVRVVRELFSEEMLMRVRTFLAHPLTLSLPSISVTGRTPTWRHSCPPRSPRSIA